MNLSFTRLIKAGEPGPDNRGIYCDDDGVFIGPDCALIGTETDCAGHTSYMLRPRSEIAHLLDAGYRTHLGLDSVLSWLNVIAKALDDGDMALAQIAALQVGLPELLDGAASERMAVADRLLKAGFNPDEPRDWHGRWTTGGDAGGQPQRQLADHAQTQAAAQAKPSNHVHFSGWDKLLPRARIGLAHIGDLYYEQTGAELTVTSGRRTPRGHAQAMYDKLQRRDNLRSLYRNTAALDGILRAYNGAVASGASDQATIDAMANVIQQQISEGVYISEHLRGDALDVRSRDMSPWQREEFERAVQEVLHHKPKLETDHYHLQF